MNGAWFGLIFAGFGSLFLLGGLWAIVMQARRLKTYLPVPATVISSNVVEKSDSDGGSTYAPNITYVYHAGDQPRESKKALVFDMSSSRGWAQKIVDRFPPGLMTQAYVHPTKPDKAFLINELSIMPYAMSMFAMIFVTVGLAIALGEQTALAWSVADCILGVAALWHAVGVFALLHYRWSGGRLKLGAQLVFLAYAGVGAIMLIVWDDFRSSQGPDPSQPAPMIEKE